MTDTTPQTPPEGPVELVCVVDRSGSMQPLAADAIGGFNAFLAGQRALPGAARLTLVLFDHEYLVPYGRVPLADVPDLDERTYVPRGSTALLDALGRALTGLAERIGAGPAAEHPAKVIVAVLTDGAENASREWTFARVSDLIKARQAAGWEFVFLAANQDAFAAASRVGISRADAFAFEASPAGTGKAFGVVHEEVARRRAAPRRAEGHS